MPHLQDLQAEHLEAIDGHRILLRADAAGMKAIDWMTAHASDLDRLLHTNGALLIRGLRIISSREFGQVLAAAFGEELLTYTYRSTPRTELRGNVYTATEYHPSETIPQHNENAYSNRWPLRIGFLCMLPADEGGATPLADSRLVYQRIPAATRARFEEKGVLYVRNYGDIDLPWTEVFQTTDKADVEQFCRENDLEFEWTATGTLRTRQVNQAVATHPVTGEKVWFNQAHLFHISALRDEVRESILSTVSEADIPRNTYYGDGSPIEDEALGQIRAAYADATWHFAWEKGDLLLLDNMLYTHGRQPYQGERQVLVGMARSADATTTATTTAARRPS